MYMGVLVISQQSQTDSLSFQTSHLCVFSDMKFSSLCVYIVTVSFFGILFYFILFFFVSLHFSLSCMLCVSQLLEARLVSHSEISAPCGLQRCKNRPAPFPG